MLKRILDDIRILFMILLAILVIALSAGFVSAYFWEYNAYNFVSCVNDGYSADITIGNSTRHIETVTELYETKTKYRIVDSYGNEYTADKSCVVLIRTNDE